MYTEYQGLSSSVSEVVSNSRAQWTSGLSTSSRSFQVTWPISVVLDAPGLDFDLTFAGSPRTKFYNALIPNYTPLHGSIKEMGRVGRHVE